LFSRLKIVFAVIICVLWSGVLQFSGIPCTSVFKDQWYEPSGGVGKMPLVRLVHIQVCLRLVTYVTITKSNT